MSIDGPSEINVPDLPLNEIRGVRISEVGFRRYSEEIHARIDTRGREYFWIAGHYEGFLQNPHSDCHVVQENMIAITPHTLIGSKDQDFSSLDPVIKRLNAKFSS